MSSDPNIGPAWGVPLNRPKVPYVELVTPRVGEKVRVVAISHHVETVPIHYYGGRTLPCLGTKEICFGCAAEVGSRPKGYLAAIAPMTGKVVVAELTEKAMEGNEERLAGEGAGLRGFGLIIYRRGNSRQGRVYLEFTQTRTPEEQLPPAPDVRTIMQRIWGVDGRIAASKLRKLEDWPPAR